MRRSPDGLREVTLVEVLIFGEQDLRINHGGAGDVRSQALDDLGKVVDILPARLPHSEKDLQRGDDGPPLAGMAQEALRSWRLDDGFG